MEYTIVFDVAQNGYRNWWFPAFGLIFVVIGSVLFRFRHQLPFRTFKFFPHIILGFSVFWTAIVFMGTAGGHFALSAFLREGRCEIVEGIVTDFRPMSPWGKGKESFTVSGKRFEYSDYNITSGFNNTSARGGPMRPGLAVRIHHNRGDIARLEIAR